MKKYALDKLGWYFKGEKDLLEMTFNKKILKKAFENWGGDSQYVTGAWNTGDYVDSDKKGEYWNFVRKNAWQQFWSYLKKEIKETQR